MKELFATCISFDNDVKGQISGNPPQIIEEQIPDDYRFYATLVHPEKKNIMLSILIHGNFDTLLKNKIYPSIAVKVIEHEYSDMGNNDDKNISTLGIGSISEYTKTQDDDFLFVTVR